MSEAVRLTRGGKIVIAVVGGLIIGAIIALVVASCGSSAPTGFHNMQTLQKSVAQTEEQDSGQIVTSVQCISTGANTASCNIQDAAGDQITVQVDISANGQQWVSH